MMQFYFMSIALNVLAGYILFAGDDAAECSCGFSFKSETVKLVVGILALVTGLMKILMPVNIPVLGDIVPAAAGILCGLVLLVEYYKIRATSAIQEENNSVGKFQVFLLTNKKVLGALAMLSAVLHFMFPYAMLL
ncbi:MAG: hypothetical protein FWH19_03675 [Treponema sp.]|nr:hypothetical protein [Treponema sp.]